MTGMYNGGGGKVLEMMIKRPKSVAHAGRDRALDKFRILCVYMKHELGDDTRRYWK